jgi:hypothetical protein
MVLLNRVSWEAKIPGLKYGKQENDKKSIRIIDLLRLPTEIKVNFCNKKLF